MSKICKMFRCLSAVEKKRRGTRKSIWAGGAVAASHLISSGS